MSELDQVVVGVESLSRVFGSTTALDNVSLDVRRGEFLTLLGPSGCGKTTLLRAIGGFDLPTAGRVMIDGQDMTGVPAHKRPVNMVFQRPTLFPHLDVAGNIGFGLRLAGLSRSEIRRRVGDALAMVRLDGFGGRRSHELSGGQQQRVALARALVNEPKVLLLDEPLSALDLRIRLEMEAELRRVHRQSGTTFVYVTHDQREALAMSDRIAVLDGGRIEQLDTPGRIHEQPASAFVARFVGSGNLVPAELAEDGSITVGGTAIATELSNDVPPAGPIWLVLRPQMIRLTSISADAQSDGQVGDAAADGAVGTVTDVAFRGTGFEYEIALDLTGTTVKAETSAGLALASASVSTRAFDLADRVTVSWVNALTALPRKP